MNILGGIDKIQHKRAVLTARCAVQAGERLNGFHAGKFFVHEHRMQQRLVKSGLILFRHDQHIEFIAVERRFQLAFLNAVHLFLGKALAVIVHFAGESDKHVQIVITVCFDVSLKLIQIPHSVQTRSGHDHRFGSAADLFLRHLTEMLDHDRSFLRNIVRM